MRYGLNFTLARIARLPVLAFCCLFFINAGPHPAAAGRDPVAALSGAIKQTEKEVEESSEELKSARARVAKERLSLVRQVSELEANTQEKRNRLTGRRQKLEEQEYGLQDLGAEVRILEEQLDGIRTLLLDRRRSFETMVSLVDIEKVAGDLAAFDRRLAPAGRDGTEIGDLADELLAMVARHVGNESGIRRSEGKAVGPSGHEWTGTFVQIGGVMNLFAGSGDGAPVGPAHLELNSSRLHIWPVASSERQSGIISLADGRNATVPVDVTAGAALQIGRAQYSLTEHIKAGGVVMVPLLGLAVICLLVGFYKLLQLSLIRTGFEEPLGTVLDLLRSGDIEAAESFASRAPGPLRPIIREGIEHRDASRESLEEILHEAIIFEVPRLEKNLSILSVGAAVAPLLGLLGTVTGMIHTFNLISVFGSGDPRMLSGGISEALITTEVGLVVAIPLLLLHAFLSRRVRFIADSLEKSAVSFINALKVRSNGAEKKEGAPVA